MKIVALPSEIGTLKPEIQRTHDHFEMLAAACGALSIRRPDLYLVGTPGKGQLVRLTDEGTQDVGEVEIAAILSNVIRWVVGKKKDGGAEHVAPPKPVVDLLDQGHGDLRRLAGISHLPLLRPDGSIHATPGFDESTRLFLRDGVDTLGPLIGSTKEDATAALARIAQAVHDTPWATAHGFYAWLAHLLTVAGRSLIAGNIPLFLYDATQAGTGKTTLAQAASWIPTGVRPEVSAVGFDRVAVTRHIGPKANDPGIILDNVHATVIRSDALESLTTAGTVTYDLKFEHAVTRPVRAAVSITVNSAKTSGDIARRSVRVHLSPKAAPTFARGCLLSSLEPQRESLACDALTILRAWILAGRPAAASHLKSFSGWSDVVGAAIEWIAYPGFVAAIGTEAKELDADEENATGLVEAFSAWLEEQGRDEATAKDVIESSDLLKGTAAQLLKEVGELQNKPTERLDATAVGAAFRKSTAWTDSGRIVSRGRSKRGARWAIEQAPRVTG